MVEMDSTYQDNHQKHDKMKLQDIKALRAYSEKTWRGVRPIFIENDISGTWETSTSNLGQLTRRFKPWTDNPTWSHWRVGIPMKYKGKKIMLWARGYHCSVGEDIMWLKETIWVIDTSREMRKSAQDKCWDYMIHKATIMATDVSDVTLKRWRRPFQADGWLCDHNGVSWGIYPATHYDPSAYFPEVTDEPRTYWVQHQSSQSLAKHCKTIKEAKSFIKTHGGAWIASNGYANF
jgi:hypothetical protein